MANRIISASHQRATLVVGGRSYSGFNRVETTPHEYPTGRITQAGARGDTVTQGVSKQGGQHTLGHPWDQATYDELRRQQGGDAQLVLRTVDARTGATTGSVRRLSGLLGAVNAGNYDAGSGEPMTFTVTFTADGDDG